MSNWVDGYFNDGGILVPVERGNGPPSRVTEDGLTILGSDPPKMSLYVWDDETVKEAPLVGFMIRETIGVTLINPAISKFSITRVPDLAVDVDDETEEIVFDGG